MKHKITYPVQSHVSLINHTVPPRCLVWCIYITRLQKRVESFAVHHLMPSGLVSKASVMYSRAQPLVRYGSALAGDISSAMLVGGLASTCKSRLKQVFNQQQANLAISKLQCTITVECGDQQHLAVSFGEGGDEGSGLF